MIRMDIPLIIRSWFWKTSQWAGQWEVALSVLRSAMPIRVSTGGDRSSSRSNIHPMKRIII